MVMEATAEIRALLIRDGCSEETADRVLAFADDIREQVAVRVEEQLESRDGKIGALASSIDDLRGEMRSGFTEMRERFTEVDGKFILIREQLAAAKVESEQRQTKLLEEIANVRVEHERSIREVDQRIAKVREEISTMRVEHERSIGAVDQRIAKVREEISTMRVEHERSIGALRLEIANLRTDAANDSKAMNARISRFGWAAMGLITTATAAIIGAVAAF